MVDPRQLKRGRHGGTTPTLPSFHIFWVNSRSGSIFLKTAVIAFQYGFVKWKIWVRSNEEYDRILNPDSAYFLFFSPITKTTTPMFAFAESEFRGWMQPITVNAGIWGSNKNRWQLARSIYRDIQMHRSQHPPDGRIYRRSSLRTAK